uniref:C-type lectin domain-containing protein n=1 Tax=Amphilophus citrinellus TaxID=61819 RepID=A0A3Q0RWT2_AMPCI
MDVRRPTHVCIFAYVFISGGVSGLSDNNKTYVYITLLRTWVVAQAYCRLHYTDLATIESSDENTMVIRKKSSLASVWISLYRIPWTWSDNSNSLFRNWQFGEPNNVGYESCVCERSTHLWNDAGCQSLKAFISRTAFAPALTKAQNNTHSFILLC